MKQGMYRVAENKALTDSVWFMALEGDTSACTATGQFINLKLDGLYLGAPFRFMIGQKIRFKLFIK